MLRQYGDIRETEAGVRRTWYSDATLDLYVWRDVRHEIVGFQLCYDRGSRERALTWHVGGGFTHDGIDDGEGNPGKGKTPLLVADGTFDFARVAALFREASLGLDDASFEAIYRKLVEYHHGPGA